jgi:hypothetical protein
MPQELVMIAIIALIEMLNNEIKTSCIRLNQKNGWLLFLSFNIQH